MTSMRTASLISACLIMLCGTASAEPKRDIQGFTPGMTWSQAKVNADRLKASEPTIECNIAPDAWQPKCKNVALRFAINLPDMPLMTVAFELNTNATKAEIIASLSEQFRATGSEVFDKLITQANAYKWQLGNGIEMLFYSGVYSVVLVNPDIIEQAKQEEFRKSRVPVPKL